MTEVREPQAVDILILGAGWTSTFLIPLLESSKISYAATTTNGRDGTIPFKFDSASDDLSQFKTLPSATTILVTFPLNGTGQSKKLVDLYTTVHKSSEGLYRWIQLGSTGIFEGQGWNDHNSPYDKNNSRAIAEDELLGYKTCQSTVLNLAGLYDNDVRQPKNWLSRVAKNKDDVQKKMAVHLVHGKDVARAIIAVHNKFEEVEGKRWIVTDLFIYDWWTLMFDWGGTLEDGTARKQAVWQCMLESSCKALPRNTGELGRVVDSTAFWNAVSILPSQGRMA